MRSCNDRAYSIVASVHELIYQGKIKSARRAIARLLGELDRSPQRLPRWVVPEAVVVLDGKPCRVTMVDRGGRGKSWNVRAELISDPRNTIFFCQERGRLRLRRGKSP